MIIYSYMKGACFEPVTDIQIKGNGSTIQPTMPASEHEGVYVHNSDDNRTYRSNGTDWMCQLEKKNINSSIVFKSKKVDGSEMELASINPLAEEDTEVWITTSKIGAVDTSTFQELNQYVKGEQLDGNGGLVKEISDLNSQINNADNGIAKQISDLNTELDTKADSSALSSYYTKKETNNKLALKADNATLNDYYKKSETNVLLSEKVSTSDLIDDSGAIKDSKLPTNILRLNQDNKISLNHLPDAAFVANKTIGALSLKIDGKLINGFSFNGSQNEVLEIPTPNHVCVKYTSALTNGVITKDTHNCGNYPIVQAFNEHGQMVQINISIGSDGAINWRQITATKLEFHISGTNDTNIETISIGGN